MSNPSLNRDRAFLRSGKKHFQPVAGDGQRRLDRESPSITQAKRYSRELMKSGATIVTKET